MASLLRLLGGPLSKMCIVTSVPISFLLFGLQAVMDVKFLCPCTVPRNTFLSVLIFFVPSLLVFLIMFLLLKPCEYKRKDKCSQEQKHNGTSQGQDSSGRSQSEKTEFVENLSFAKIFSVCFVPSIVWMCLFLIDGDYFACAMTDWDGRYACDNELHPHCLNWCKPTKLSPGKNETECYNRTRGWIYWSKITGYGLAVFFCIVGIFVVTFTECKSGTSACGTDQERMSVKLQVPGIEEQPLRATLSEQH